MEGREEKEGTLSGAFISYLMWIAVLVVLFMKAELVIDESFYRGLLWWGVYFVAGWNLTKRTLPSIVEWHPVYDTLWNVTSIKLRVFFLWPIAFAQILFRLFVDKVL